MLSYHINMKQGERKILYIIAMLFFAFCYVWSVKRILPEYYYIANTPIVLYNKKFSYLNLFYCIFVLIMLFILTDSIGVKNKMAYFSLRIMFIFYCIPMTMSLCLFENYLKFWLLGIFYWISLCFYIYFFEFKVKRGKYFLTINCLDRCLLVVSILLIIIFIVKGLKNFQFSLSLDDVYSVRETFKENMSNWMVFFKTSFGTYIIPCILVFSLRHRKKCLFCLFLLAQGVVFSFAKDKIYLFYGLVAIVIGIFGDRIVNKFNNYMSYAMILFGSLNIVAIIGYFQNLFFFYFTRRLFVIPTWLNYLYITFFSGSPKLMWKQDVFLIDKLFTPVYEQSVREMISEAYFKGKVSGPNAGMLAEAYSQFGIFGIIIYPLLIVILLNVLEYLFATAMDEVKLMASISLAISIVNDTITSTTFVVVMLIICMYAIFFRERIKKENA